MPSEGTAERDPRFRQRSEQYFTFSQSRSHFFLQANGSPQVTHTFSGLTRLFLSRAMGRVSLKGAQEPRRNCVVAGKGGTEIFFHWDHRCHTRTRLERIRVYIDAAPVEGIPHGAPVGGGGIPSAEVPGTLREHSRSGGPSPTISVAASPGSW